MRKGKNIVAVIAFVVAIFLAFGLEGQSVLAHSLVINEDPIFVSPDTGDGDVDNSDSGYIDVDYSPGSIYDGVSVLEANASLGVSTQLGAAATDSSYDLRDYNRVTPVRNQFSGGTCWSFAAICSSESSAITEGLKPYSADLSELQLAYFMYHTVSDPMGNYGSDGVYFGPGQDYDYFTLGGNDLYATMTLAKWVGVTNELPNMAYPSNYNIYPSADYASEYAFSYDSMHLENALWVDIGDKEAVQSNLINYGAATVSIYYDNAYLNTDSGKKGAYYYNGTSYGNNHAVSIVGWDDNYSKTNFLTQPPGNGAWLIKNSYGTSHGDNGYLWVSYYDRGITGSNSTPIANTLVFTDYGTYNNYDNNYQYDGGVSLHCYSYPNGTASMANVFTADGFEKLEAISFYTYRTNVNYTVKIYKLDNNDIAPIGGTLVASESGNEIYAGYHTIELGNIVDLAPGDKFSVVIDMTSASGYAYIMVDASGSLFGTTYPYSFASCNAGESYMSGDGSNWSGMSYNCRIKAFTTADDSINITIKNPANSHLIRQTGSGTEIQSGVTNAINQVVYTAEPGYYVPLNYSVTPVNGVSVTRNSYNQITVSGTPTASVVLNLVGITQKSSSSAPSGISAGTQQIIGTTTAMEYASSDTASSWTTCNSQYTPVSSGIWYVRYIETDTANASLSTQVLVVGSNDTIDVNYRTHVQNVGWQAYVSNGGTSGTAGQSLRLEGINIYLDSFIEGSIRYRTHVQNIGWQDWVNDGDLSGTSGRGLRLEAIQIDLTGSVADYFDVYYRVQAQDYGWLGWAKNGANAGTAGQGKRLEAIQIMVVRKGQEGPASQYYSYVEYAKVSANSPTSGSINYFTHVQNYGNQNYVYDGSVAGTFGEGLRLEGLTMNLVNPSGVGGSIRYCTHVQNIGWQDWVTSGSMSGTSGQGLRLEAMKIELTGDMANAYDVYYRVHAQDFGWLGWAKNGEMSGTSGCSKRLEALQVILVPKGQAAPGDTSSPYVAR